VLQDEVHEEPDLVGDLVLAEVDVAVVLLELTDARHPGESAGELVAVQHVLGGEAERELAVRVPLRSVVQVVRGAVHRLQRHVVLAGLGVQYHEHVLAVLAPVAGLFPERLGVEQRRPDLVEAAPLAPAHELHQRVV
jgi:hypothetical protein